MGFFGEFYIALSRVARIRLSQGYNRTRQGSAWPIGCMGHENTRKKGDLRPVFKVYGCGIFESEPGPVRLLPVMI